MLRILFGIIFFLIALFFTIATVGGSLGILDGSISKREGEGLIPVALIASTCSFIAGLLL